MVTMDSSLSSGSAPAPLDQPLRLSFCLSMISSENRYPLFGIMLLSIYFGMTAEIGGGDGFIAPQLVGLAAEHDAAGFQHVAVIGDGKSHARVLLDKQHRGVLPDLRDDPEHRLHDDGRKPQRRLVEQQQP